MLKMLSLTKTLYGLAQNIAKQQFQNHLKVLPPASKFATSSIQKQSQPVELITQNVIQNINKSVEMSKMGRLFAVVHLCGKQFKITSGDIIIVDGYWPPETGDQIKLEKVLVVGSSSFSLIGRPLINKDLIDIQATIIEKSLSHTKTHFRKKRRKQFKRINFYRCPSTMIMINSIEIKDKLN